MEKKIRILSFYKVQIVWLVSAKVQLFPKFSQIFRQFKKKKKKI